MKNSVLVAAFALSGLALVATGCDSKDKEKETTEQAQTDAESQKAESKEAEKAEPEAKTFEPPEGWKIVDHTNPDPEVKKLLDPARKGQGHLGIRLIGELTQAVNSQGAAEAVKVCNTSVSGIRQGVEAEFGVEVGRTSHKLRNPKNTPPEFMKPIVEARYDKPVAMQGPDGEIAWSYPLRLGPICANCHGTEDKIAPGVNDKLAELYPEDEAKGFKVGELRGWIWSKSTPDT